MNSLAQPQSYHDFADQRTLWGIPHTLDVMSNLAFIAVGLWGLVAAGGPDRTGEVHCDGCGSIAWQRVWLEAEVEGEQDVSPFNPLAVGNSNADCHRGEQHELVRGDLLSRLLA